MNITQLLNKIKDIAEGLQTTNSSFIGDVSDIWNTAEVEYASFVVSVTSVQRENNVRNYNLILYYGDRLLQNKSNIIAVWDDAVNTIQSVLNKLSEYDVEYGDYTVELFEQKFNDVLAGGYAVVDVITEDDLGECEMEE